jgi:hypothetical protein
MPRFGAALGPGQKCCSVDPVWGERSALADVTSARGYLSHIYPTQAAKMPPAQERPGGYRCISWSTVVHLTCALGFYIADLGYCNGFGVLAPGDALVAGQ